MTDHEYGAMVWCWERAGQRHGLSVKTFPLPTMPRDPGEIVDAAVRCGVQLSVSGHCHWAYGSYRCAAAPGGPAFVVAANCGGGWNRLLALEGTRLDKKWDLLRGGYNVRNPPIVADIAIEPPLATDKWVIH